MDAGADVENVGRTGVGGVTLIAGDAAAPDVPGPRKLKVGGLSATPEEAGADGVVVGALGGSAAFGGKMGAAGVGVGFCVVDGVGCPNLNPVAGVGLG